MENQNQNNTTNLTIEQLVYDTLLNALEEEYPLPWVAPIFVPGHPCYNTYCDMLSAYERLRQRLDVQEEDADVEAIISSLLMHGRILALEMFRYGRIFQLPAAEQTAAGKGQ